MVNIRKVVLSALSLALACGTAFAASLNASVNRAKVAMGETFTLNLQAVGSVDNTPNFRALTRNFTIISTGQSSQVSIINGKMESSKQWQIVLSPKRQGTLQIPSLSAGNVRSNPLSIKVTRVPQATAKNPRNGVFMEVSAKPQVPFVGQQVHYQVKLFYDVSVQNASLTPPSSKQAKVNILGNPLTYQATIKGKRYQVSESNFEVIPQQPGGLTINPPVLSGEAVNTNPSSFNSFFSQGRAISVTGKPITLHVKAVPSKAKNIDWLPARSLKLSQSWSTNPPVFKVGQPITRTLTLTSVGVKAAQLPTIAQQQSIANVNTYPDKPILKNETNGNWINGSRVEKIAYIPSQPGKITLPAIKIPWWNTVSNKLRYVRLPAKTFNVTGTAQSAAPTMTPAAQKLTPVKQRLAQVKHIITKQSHTTFWVAISAVLFVLWLVTIVIFMRRKGSVQVQDNIKQPEPNQPSLKQAERSLKNACDQNDATAAQAAILLWAQHIWPEAKPANLAEVGHMLGDAAVAQQLDELAKTLYAAHAHAWQGGASLWQSFKAFRKPKQRVQQKDTSLPPLY